ncbi:MAG TPA: FAD-binding oxidoreductase [Thermohalobaculum sp.]|nr:FAD-binding oxidoreductase [Thermohalobaculum sp.]
MTSRLFTEDFKAEPYWWEAAPPREPEGAWPPDSADVAVVGSGYTGLNAALQLARGGRDVVVLEAETPGWGCSTRNGGQVSTSTKPEYDALARKHGPEIARAVVDNGHEALAWIGDFVRAEGIDCDFRVCGRFHAAHSAAAFERLRRSVAKETPALKAEAELVPRAEQRREIGTDAYHGGVVYPRHAALHPGRYHAGLLDRVLEAGAAVHGRCPVEALEREAEGFVVKTPRGTIRARNVVLATNGYTGRYAPWLRRRVIPIGSYVIATEPLEPAVVDRVIPQHRVVSDTRRIVYYYRASPDRRRILFGGRVSSGETDPLKSGPKLHAEMVRLFPELGGSRISHSWLGFVAYTFDTMAHLGERDGLFYSAGYCGSGVSMASFLGMRLGQKVLGLEEGRTGLDGVPFPTRPYYFGRPWFLAPAVMAYRLRDRLGV